MENNTDRSETNYENDKYIDYINALRTIACFAVITLHVSALNTYNVDFQSSEWNIFMFYESIVNWAVPVFVMISGSVMLRKNYEYKDILKKCGRLIGFFLAWTVLYFTFDIFNYGIATYKDMLWLQVILQGHYHMWYLIMLCGLYLLVPIIKAFIDKQPLRKAFISLSVIFSFLLPAIKDLSKISRIERVLQNPVIGSVYRAFINVHDDLNYHFTIGFVSYFVIGYVLANYIDSKRRKLVGTGLGLILIGTIITFLEIRYASSKETTVVFLQHYQPGIFLQACGIFLFAKALSGSAFLKFFVKISPLTLGIYMLHPMIIEDKVQ